jgi:hypothetical protein
MQALQQQQGAGADVGDMLQQLMKMSPDEVAAVLQQMGIQVSPEQVQTAAENWVDQAADDASGNPAQPSTQADDGGESPEDQSSPDDAHTPSSSAPTDNEPAEPAPDDEEAEGEGQLPAGARPTAYSGAGSTSGDPRMAAALAAAQGGGGAMPRGVGSAGPPGIPSGPMDDLISAQMMQRAVGNPNAAVPTGPGVPMPRSAGAIPNPRPSGAANNPRMAAMIADLYRSTGGKGNRRPRQPSAKPSAR